MAGSEACAKIRTSPDERRRKVLDVARNLFRTQGFHSTGIAQISKASRIHVAQLYRDFGSKEAIIAAIAEEEVQSSFEQTGEAPGTTADIAAAPDGLRAWLRAKLERVTTPDHISLFTEVVAEASRNPAIAAMLQAIDARIRQHLTAAFARTAPPAHSPAAIDLVVDLFIVLVSGLQVRLVTHPDLDRDAMIGKVVAIIESELSGYCQTAREPATR